LIFVSYSYSNISSCQEINFSHMDDDREVRMNGSINTSNVDNCITIKESNFLFDCNGNTIDANVSLSLTGILYNDTEEIGNITIRNCIISNWQNNGIDMRGENLDNIYFENISFSRNTNNDIYIYGPDYLIFNNINSSYGRLYIWNSEFLIINNSLLHNVYDRVSHNCKIINSNISSLLDIDYFWCYTKLSTYNRIR
jgi:hypothetical protein